MLGLLAFAVWLPGACGPGNGSAAGPRAETGTPAARNATEPAGPGAGSRGRTARVVEVLDGDTVVLAGGMTVRYPGIDAPERDARGFRAARRRNRALVGDRRVRLVPLPGPGQDRHGRRLARVLVAGPAGGTSPDTDVAERLLREGLVRVYRVAPDALPEPWLERYLAAQREALEARRGGWEDLDARAAAAGRLAATRLRIHRAGCRHLASARPRPLRDLEAALRAGKSPCRTCRPLSRAR